MHRHTYSVVAALFSIASILIFAVSCLVYAHYVGPDITSLSPAWGQFGDFIGGFVGTTIGLLTLFALAATLHLQSTMLRETRQTEALKLRPILKAEWTWPAAVHVSQGMPFRRLNWQVRNVGLGAAIIQRISVHALGKDFGSHAVKPCSEFTDIWTSAIGSLASGNTKADLPLQLAPMNATTCFIGIGEHIVLAYLDVPDEVAQLMFDKLSKLEPTIHFSSMAGEALSTENQLRGF